MYGGFKLQGKEMHDHGEMVYGAVSTNAVGEIKENFERQIFRPVGNPPKEKLADQSWKIVSKKMLTGVHGIFQFENPNYKIAGMLPYFDHCGKYFTVIFHKLLAPFKAFECTT